MLLLCFASVSCVSAGQSCENTLKQGGEPLGAAFAKMYAGGQQGKRRRTATPGTDVDGEDDYRETISKWRATTVRLTNSNLFKIMLAISTTVKEPLIHFHNWATKLRGQRNKTRKGWLASGVADPATMKSMVCNLVSHKADAIYSEISCLLETEAERGAWAPIWKHAEPNQVNEVRQLIVSSTCMVAANWEKRFLERVRSFPLLFFIVLAFPRTECSPRRKSLAKMLLDECLLCLKRVWDDAAVKIRTLCFEDWTFMKESGQCTEFVWAILQCWRALFDGESAEVETYHAALQRLTDAAPCSCLRGWRTRASI